MNTNKSLFGGCFVILFIVALAGVALVGMGGCSVWNTRNDIQSGIQDINTAWGNVQAQYQRRMDLIPNLVKTLEAQGNFEKSTLQAVVDARASATRVTIDPSHATPDQIAAFQEAQKGLGGALSRLMVASENYPNLQTNEGFRDFRVTYEGTENRIVVKLGDYNTSITPTNKKITTGIFSIVNSCTNWYKEFPYYKADDGAEKAPSVNFGSFSGPNSK